MEELIFLFFILFFITWCIIIICHEKTKERQKEIKKILDYLISTKK